MLEAIKCPVYSCSSMTLWFPLLSLPSNGNTPAALTDNALLLTLSLLPHPIWVWKQINLVFSHRNGLGWKGP